MIKKIITDIKEIEQVPNDHYVDIVKRSCGEKPTSIPKQGDLTNDNTIVNHIVHHFEDHLSIRTMKNNIKSPQNSKVSLLPISELKVQKIIKALSTKKSAEWIRCLLSWLNYGPLSQSINNSIKKGYFLKMLQPFP